MGKLTWDKLKPVFTVGGVIAGAAITVLVIFKACGYDVGALRSDINHLEKEVGDVEGSLLKIEEVMNVIRTDVSSLSTSIGYINTGLAEVKENTKDLNVLRSDTKDLKENFDRYQEKTDSEINKIRLKTSYGGNSDTGYGELGADNYIVTKTYKGRVGIITEEMDADTASGWKYDPNSNVAAKNLNSRLRNARFGEMYLIVNTEYASKKMGDVVMVDTFYSSPDILLAISPSVAGQIGFPLEKGLIKAEVKKVKPKH